MKATEWAGAVHIYINSAVYWQCGGVDTVSNAGQQAPHHLLIGNRDGFEAWIL